MTATLTTAALSGAELAINKALAYDPASRRALSRLSGEVLAITLTAPALTVYLAPEGERLQLWGYWEGQPSVQLRGSISDLARLAANSQSNLKTSGVEVSGDTGVLLELRTLLQNLDIDWEEALSQLLGDLAGHGGALLLRETGQWFRGRAHTGRRVLSEFVTEELRLLPPRNELESFYRAVDQLRLDVDRAEARLRQLKSSSGVAADAEQKD